MTLKTFGHQLSSGWHNPDELIEQPISHQNNSVEVLVHHGQNYRIYDNLQLQQHTIMKNSVVSEQGSQMHRSSACAGGV
jgi:hypothetical protein